VGNATEVTHMGGAADVRASGGQAWHGNVAASAPRRLAFLAEQAQRSTRTSDIAPGAPPE